MLTAREESLIKARFSNENIIYKFYKLINGGAPVQWMEAFLVYIAFMKRSGDGFVKVFILNYLL